MSFKMIYDARNRGNLDKLADNTKAQAYKWYQYCIDNKVDILIYETIRTKAQQVENVRKGASKTLNSYHIVGQAFDFVPVNKSGQALWSIQAYTIPSVWQCINYAKRLGFTWGGDWDNDGNWRDETFLDSPHMQYNYKGYGADTFGKSVGATKPLDKSVVSSDSTVKAIQSLMNSRYNAKIVADGYYGDKTREALLIALKKEYNENYSVEMGRTIGSLDGSFGSTLNELFSKVTLSENVKVSDRITYILQASLYVNGHKEIGALDGKWGANTIKTLNNFRKSKGFKDNGLVGGSTWKELLG